MDTSAVIAAGISAASLITVAMIQTRHGKVLKGIDRAVNNVEPGGAPLWKRIDNQTELIGQVHGEFKVHVERDEKVQGETLATLRELIDLKDLLRGLPHTEADLGHRSDGAVPRPA